MKKYRGQIYSPGGYRVECMDCDESVVFLTEEQVRHPDKEHHLPGWRYWRGWWCPKCVARW